MLPSAMVDRRLALETKDWLRILDLSLSQDVALIQCFNRLDESKRGNVYTSNKKSQKVMHM